MLTDIDASTLIRMTIPEGDSAMFFSKGRKKHSSFIIDYDSIKLRDSIDKLKVKLNQDYQCCIYSVKDPKLNNRKENLFRSKIYMWLDIDYKNCEEATEERIYNLDPTPSIIIRTPGGFHVMWVGVEPVVYSKEMDDFYKSFMDHAAYQGIIADSQGSPEKYFRMIGNLGSDFRTVIKGFYTGETYSDFKSFKDIIPKTEKEVEMISNGMTSVGKNQMIYEDLMEMITKCPQMKHFEETGGSNREEWIRYMMIFAFTASKDLMRKELIFGKFLECSSKYPDYNGRENEQQFSDMLRRYESGQYQLIPSCDSLREISGQKCVESCAEIPYKNMIGKCSYMRFTMPESFVESNGKIFKVTKSGDMYEVMSEAIKPLYSIKDDVDGLHWLKMQGNKRIITLEEEIIPKTRDMLSILSAHHIVCPSERDAGVYIKHCQKQARLIHGTNRMGVYDGNVQQSNDHDVFPIFAESSDPFFRTYTGKNGDVEPYMNCVTYLARSHPLFALAYAVSMVQMLPYKLHSNIVVRMYGRAGIGKTLLLRYAKSSIGNPNLFPIQRNVTPLMLVRIASRTSFFALDELVVNSDVNYKQVIDAIFAIGDGNRRLTYKETDGGKYYTSMLATGEQRFTMNKARDTGIHRRVYELYANVTQKLKEDMIAGMPIITVNYGFARYLKQGIYDRVEAIKKAQKDSLEVMKKFDHNINHQDMITSFSHVIGIAHVISGISLEELCNAASSIHTFEGTDGMAGIDDLTDYCTNAFMVMKSLYNEYYDKRRVIITSTDLEVELKRHELDYYPEVMEFVKNIYGWDPLKLKDNGKRTTRTGIIVRETYPPMVKLIQYFVDLNEDTKMSLARGINVANSKVESMQLKPYQFKLLINVISDLRKKNGVEDFPPDAYQCIQTIKEELHFKETGLKLVVNEGYIDSGQQEIDFTQEIEEEEMRWEH